MYKTSSINLEKNTYNVEKPGTWSTTRGWTPVRGKCIVIALLYYKLCGARQFQLVVMGSELEFQNVVHS